VNNSPEQTGREAAPAENGASPFDYKVVWESDGMMLHSDPFCDEDAAKAYAAYRRLGGSRKTEVWRRYQYRDELQAMITNETLIEEWPF